MKIFFNLADAGLANNGGSQTIIRMALAIKKLNNEVKIIINQPNRFTWFKFDEDIILSVKSKPKEWPICDAMIATACSTVRSTLDYPHIPLKNKFYWIRGFEIWAQTECNLVAGYKSGLNLMVNSEWQRRSIFNFTQISPTIVYPGIPIVEIEDNLKFQKETNKEEKYPLVLGGLYYIGKASKKFEEVIRIANKCFELGFIKKLLLFGDEQISNEISTQFKVPIEFCLRPSMAEKVNLMRHCDVWLTTSENEGLHIPPMEAGICGCAIVVKDFTSSGVSDFAIHGYSSLNFLTEAEAVECIKYYFENKLIRLLHRFNLSSILSMKIGSVDFNANKMVKIIMEKVNS